MIHGLQRWSCPRLAPALLVAAAVLSPLPAEGGDRGISADHQDMLETIARHARSSTLETGVDDFSARTMEAMAGVERHHFVPEALRDAAYEDRPLPIGQGQTISQPFIVALMTELLDPEPGDRVLEVGTGSGYQAAVLSRLVERVYTIEIVEVLAEQARERLARLGYDNVETRLGDGYHGWPEAAPFDGIVVTAAAEHVPPPLVQQLRPGGRMVIPVGDRFAVQQLLLIEKTADAGVRTRQLLPVRFVPLTGER